MARGWGAATGGQRSFRHGPADYFEPGTWNIRCWTCYKKIKSSEAQKLSIYDGNGWVCRTCYELPNPQNFVRGIPDRQHVPFVQNAPPLFVGNDASTGQVPANGNNMVGGPMVGGPMVG